MSDNKTAKMAAEWLRKAADLIDGDRQDEYGDFLLNTKFVSEQTGVSIPDSIDVMIGYKNARLIHSPLHEDSIVDKIGYCALKEAVRVRELKGE